MTEGDRKPSEDRRGDWVDKGQRRRARAEARSVGGVERSTVTQAKDNGLVQGVEKD